MRFGRCRPEPERVDAEDGVEGPVERGRRRLNQRKLAELDEQIAKAGTARDAIRHALRCPHEDVLDCPNFASIAAARLAGEPLHEAHSHVH